MNNIDFLDQLLDRLADKIVQRQAANTNATVIPPTFPVSQVAKHFPGVATRTAADATRRDELESFRVGRVTVVTREAVEKWLASKRKPARVVPVNPTEPSDAEVDALIDASLARRKKAGKR